MVKTLKKHTKQYLPPSLLKHLEHYSYVFNPSIVCHLDSFLMSMRVYDTASKTIQAHLYAWKEDAPYSFINLTEYFMDAMAIQKVADPKLFVMNNEVWGTFNTGYISEGTNQLVLFQMKDAKIQTYFICVYSKRTSVEKNWAFFMKDNSIYALYGIEQGNVLKATSSDVATGGSLNFETYTTNKENNYKGYTIGTPLVALSNTTYGCIGHKKITVKGKRLYLGRAFKFSPFTEKPLETSSPYLIHSLSSLRGTSFKFNKNLISCTYFSGLTMYNDEFIISYGINDVAWNMVSIKKHTLWA